MEKLQVRFTESEVLELISVLEDAAHVLDDVRLSSAAHRFAVHLEDRRIRYWHQPTSRGVRSLILAERVKSLGGTTERGQGST